ncbi:uncharacterized protein CXorf49 homolog [Dama dama]
MSSPDDEVSVWGAGFGSEGREQTCIPSGRLHSPTGTWTGLQGEDTMKREGEGGDGYPNPEGFNLEWVVLEAGGGGAVLWGCQDQLGSLADDKGEALQLADESVAAILWQVSDLDILGVRRYLSLESYVITDVSSLWADLEVGGAEAGRAWGNPKRGTKSKLNVAADHQQPPSEGSFGLLSDSESSDEFSEIELMRVSIYPKEGGQAKLNSLKGPRNTPGHSTTSATPLEPSPLPPVSGIPLLGRSKKYALVPWGAEESKHMGAGAKSVARRAREAVSPMAVVGEDNDPNRDPITKGQARVIGRSAPTATLGVDLQANSLFCQALFTHIALPGDQEPTNHSPRRERKQQPPGMLDCPQVETNIFLQEEQVLPLGLSHSSF